jgi:protein TonB
VTIDSSIIDLTFRADPAQRLHAPAEWQATLSRRRFAILLFACFVIHALWVAILLFQMDPDADRNMQAPEIPVEVIVDPPKPEEEKQEPPAPPQPKPEPQKPQYYEKPAYDAPRPPNEEKRKAEAFETESKAPLEAKPSEAAAERPQDIKAPPLPPQAEPAESEMTASKLVEDKPEAEALDKALPAPEPAPENRTKAARTKPELSKEGKADLARQLAALTPAPHFSFAAPAKPAPISGGTGQGYLSVLYGLIMKQKRDPVSVHALRSSVTVEVLFYIDETGNLTHQAVGRTSGHRDLDESVIAAIRRAAPFPPPPHGAPHGFVAHIDFGPS